MVEVHGMSTLYFGQIHLFYYSPLTSLLPLQFSNSIDGFHYAIFMCVYFSPLHFSLSPPFSLSSILIPPDSPLFALIAQTFCVSFFPKQYSIKFT
jgi:hypothetical protein